MVSWGYRSDISFDIESLDGYSTNLLAATYDGVQYSTNGGQSWTTANGLDSGVVLKLAVSPTSSSNVLAATYGGGVWRSTDSGRNWSESNSGLPASGGYTYAYDVAFAPGGTTAYAATYGVYRSTNGGQSWSAAYTGASDWFRALDVAGNGTVVAGSNTRGVYFGIGGTSWMARNTSLTEQRIRAVKVVQTTPDLTVMAGTNGRSGWLYTLRMAVYLPLVLRQYPRPSWTTILNETFEGSFPGAWTVFDGNDSSYGTYYWGKRTCRPYAGSYSGWAVGGGANGASLSCGSNYPNYARSVMIYGPFSLADAYAADLQFKLWLNSESGYDFICWMASPDGSDFTGPCASGSSGGWIDRVLNFSSVPNLGNLLGDPSVWIAFLFISDSSVTRSEGAYVDNIVLRKCTHPGGCASGTALAGEAGPAEGEWIELPASLVLPQFSLNLGEPHIPGP